MPLDKNYESKGAREQFRFDPRYRCVPLANDFKLLPKYKVQDVIEYLENPLVIEISVLNHASKPTIIRAAIQPVKASREGSVEFYSIDDGFASYTDLEALVTGRKLYQVFIVETYEVLGRYNDLEDKGSIIPSEMNRELIETLNAIEP